jgi:hypothetical protein
VDTPNALSSSSWGTVPLGSRNTTVATRRAAPCRRRRPMRGRSCLSRSNRHSHPTRWMYRAMHPWHREVADARRAPPRCRSMRSDRSKHGRPPAPTAKHTEPRSPADAVGGADRTRVGDRAHPCGRRTPRQTVVATLVAMQNGTSGTPAADGCVPLQAPDAAVAWATTSKLEPVPRQQPPRPLGPGSLQPAQASQQ